MNLIDRIATRMGYTRTPNPLSHLAHESKVEDGVSIAPHLKGEASFDYAKVKTRNWAFFYDSDGCFHYAIGHRDWMPLQLAGFIVGQNYHDGIGLFSDAINNSMWLAPDTPIHKSWLDSNQDVFQEIEAIKVSGEGSFTTGQENAEEFTPMMFPSLPAAVVSWELTTTWRRYQPHCPRICLSTTHEHNLLSSLPMMLATHEAPKAALIQLLDWTADWFEAQGYVVNRDEQLMKVPGYQPLFYVDSEPGGY